MLYSFLTSLIETYSFLNVFRYLTFRTGLSVVTSLMVVFIIGGPLIKIFSENSGNDELIGFEEKNTYLFSIMNNYKIYNQLNSELNKIKYYKAKKDISFKNIYFDYQADYLLHLNQFFQIK